MSESYGVVTATRTVRIERVLPGRIERVWEYLTDANLRGTWLGAPSWASAPCCPRSRA